jgi:hypothetical protein
VGRWWFTDSTAGKADMPLRMISTIVKGNKAMAAGTTSVGLGVLVHLSTGGRAEPG